MGRPGRDYDNLFEEFSATELSRREFLKQKGIDPSCGSACRNTGDWETRRIKLHLVRVESLNDDAVGERPSSETSDPAFANPAIPETNVDCDRLAQILSHQLETILHNNSDSCHVQSLSVTDIAKLTSVLAQLQLIRQRAKGVWGQNIPKKADDNNASDKALSTAPFQVPIYEVQIDKSGKFKRARPTLVEYYEMNCQDGYVNDQDHEKSLYIVESKNFETGKYEPISPRKARNLTE